MFWLASAYSGVGAEQIDRPVGALGSNDQLLDILFPGNITGHGEPGDSSRRFRSFLGKYVSNDNASTLIGKRLAQGLAYATGAPGNDDSFIFEIHYSYSIGRGS